MAGYDIKKVSILGKESIHCGFHLVPYIVETVLSTLPSSTYVLVTDTIVASYHLKKFQDAFAPAIAHGLRFLYHVVPPGETSKSRSGKAAIEDFLLEHKCTRDTVILALGGGVIGDLVGFVAATFMRGVRFCQIPTTLLAMVDSSVGGKTAIDTPHGKNLIGAFWQPEYIFIDAAFLETLPPREFSNGMAEVIKTAAIWNEEEFTSLESRSSEIFAAIQTPSSNNTGRTLPTRSAAQDLLLSVIVGSISVKSHIVTIDERETGLRNLVNFGHSIGHAIEAVLTPTILHGECVAVGMVLEAEVARQMGVLGQVAVGRLTRCLKAYNLPVSLSDARIVGLPAAKLLTVDRLLDIMKIDKKNSGPAAKIVILSRIGKTYEEKATVVPDEVIRRTLCPAVRVIPSTPSKSPIRMATPGSKSISNRALLLAALGKGRCKLTNLLHSDDTQVMMNALIDLGGAKFSWEDGGETLVVEGGEGALSSPSGGKEVYLGNAGTAARFLTTVCTLVRRERTTGGEGRQEQEQRPTVITGNARMKQRPVGPLVDALRANGSSIQFKESEGCLPLAIAPGGLKGGKIRLAASISSQYVSSILLCAPYAATPIQLELTGGQVISQPYIDMTIAMMRSFGISVTRHTDPQTGALLDVYTIPKGTYKNPPSYVIESDASSATYPLAIAAITGTTCTIEGIGSGSLQGDARFAVEVLRRMGCEVEQTEGETSVTGPRVGGLKAVGEVDMETMTDAFLTACVVAAVAGGGGAGGQGEQGEADGDGNGEGGRNTNKRMNMTRIVGIANQRVKECNRIRAMIDQLAKFGIETKELPDGLEVYGKPIEELKQGVSVHCYDDHRVAMAFSVLGTVVGGTVLEEKRCVEKTWPSWWDDLENKIGIKVEGVELSATPSMGSPSKQATEDTSNSVLLIGMRGSGKTFIGAQAAEALGWTFLDADDYLEQKHQIGVRQFVQERGWEAFRAAETEVLKELLEKKPRGHVISLGGGIVETPEAREALKAYAKTKGAVVHIVREIEEVVRYLGEETARPAYGEPVVEVFRRREPWFGECSSYDFVNYTSQKLNDEPATTTSAVNRGQYDFVDPEQDLEQGFRAEVARFFQHVSGVRPNLAENVAPGRRSYFLSLTYPDVREALAKMDELTAGVDAVELRVDLLRAPGHADLKGNYIPPTSYVVEQVALLRRRTTLPIVFTVRSVSQGGSHPDGAEKGAFALFEVARRLGCEYVDVELAWSKPAIREFAQRKGHSWIIASWHDWSGKMKWNSAEVKEKYDIAHEVGDVIKIVGKATSFEDNFALRSFVESIKSRDDAKPLIAINTGYEGQLSRILNTTFSPVTHPLLSVSAAPGQLSFAQIQRALHLMGLLPAKKFYLFGSPIAKSPSPVLHNTIFESLGLPYNYSLFETDAVDERIRNVVRDPAFGGASVTIPHKLAIIPLLDRLTEHAEVIGAVNTVVPLVERDGTRVLVGDNTDWLGILHTVRAKVSTLSTKPTMGLVIGAGGTSRAALYALHKLGLNRIYLYNRTRSSAEALVAAFPSFNIEVVDSLDSFSGPRPTIIVSTVPGQAISSSNDSHSAINIPKELFAGECGVAVDMAYIPKETALLSVASKNGWRIVYGVQVLLEQGYHQSSAWTGRQPPRFAATARVREQWLNTNTNADSRK